ncbi:MAG TPA: sigma 54-interacting transcriptional regulator [Polyangiaceae bacterium]|nr:sigma 54-interacting transcriptional regulator [Polyangiaceae bacterium]
MSDSTSDEETTPETGHDVGGGTRKDGDVRVATGLVVLWSSDEPDYLGSWLPVVSGEGNEPRLLGRGRARADDQHPRLSSFQQRPEHNELLPPLCSEALSRSQLLIRPLEQATLEVTNLGRRKLSVNGALADQHEVRPGDVLEIGNRLVLICSTRPQRLPGSAADPTHAFGQPDEHGLVGESPFAWQLRTDVAFAARRSGHVLILGATGAGKELVAAALHALSARSGPLISRNAATLPESLVDAELFGNPKGYPNPGVPEREGLIGAAHQGSLFLDEFADLPEGAQSHILRVLDSGEYQRLGESRQRHSDFRLIAATNRPESALREDLLARFVFRLRVPDLVARREDIPLILRHLFTVITRDEPELRERYCQPNGLPRMSPGFIRRLVQHAFPGNVRELRQLLWRSLAESSNDSLEWPEDVGTSSANENATDPPKPDLQRALDANNGSLEKTWRALGLPNRYVLRRLIAKHGLTVTRRGGGN